jgi:mevalonate kinase
MRAAAPGKLILTGEHAVVYGCPALVTAVDRRVEASVEPTADSNEIVLKQPGLAPLLRFSHAGLRQLLTQTRGAYAAFDRGECPIETVLPQRTQLAALALAQVLENSSTGARRGLEVLVRADLPVGCGMGASAAIALAVLKAAAATLGVRLTDDQLYERAVSTERFIHGRPSGVDPYACLHGGMWRFQADRATRVGVPDCGFSAVYTGVPECSTGECVAAVAAQSPAASVWEAFAATTDALETALKAGNEHNLRQAVRRNHRLLCTLGVVPPRVRRFVDAVEAAGGAAKISGAGAISGEAGGMVLVFADARPAALCRDFAYDALPLRSTAQGVGLLAADARTRETPEHG